MNNLPTLSVGECVRQLNAVLTTQVVSVEGEVQGFSVSQNRWGFFSLKDPNGENVIECFIMAFRLRMPIEDGMTVRILATPGIHPRSGRFRLTVESIELVGEGGLRRAFELLKRKLETEGLFSSARKRTLPAFPIHIGLIASRDSAAYSDFLKVIQARFGGLTIHTVNVQVQGPSATKSIIDAMRAMEQHKPPLDVIVITRGGGSLEDLMAFNDETLAREVFRCSIPVVSAVGHERDVTIVDLVADVRASTPSNAAELLVPHKREVERSLSLLSHRLHGAMEHRLILAKHDIDRLTHLFTAMLELQHRALALFTQRFSGISIALVSRQRQLLVSVNELGPRMAAAHKRRMKNIRQLLDERHRHFMALSPERLLSRGYSIVRLRGRVVQSTGQLRPGNRIDVALSDGHVAADVSEI